MKERASSGTVCITKQAKVLSYEDEELLWQKRLLGSSIPHQLMKMLLFLISMQCALRVGSEYRNLRWLGFNSQFRMIFPGGVWHLVYTEDLVSKTNPGGLKHKKVKAKEVTIYPNSDKSHCLVAMFVKYHSKLLMNCKCGALYLHPHKVFTEGAWYMDSPMGINSLHNIVKDLCTEAGLEGFYSNHSLHSMAVTRLYQVGIDEQLVCEITGHRSNYVCLYKRTSNDQKRCASQVIMKKACTDSS